MVWCSIVNIINYKFIMDRYSKNNLWKPHNDFYHKNDPINVSLLGKKGYFMNSVSRYKWKTSGRRTMIDWLLWVIEGEETLYFSYISFFHTEKMEILMVRWDLTNFMSRPLPNETVVSRKHYVTVYHKMWFHTTRGVVPYFGFFFCLINNWDL